VAALIPIIPYLFVTGLFAIGISVVAGLVALFVLGMAKGRLVQRSPILQGLEILGIGVASAGIGYLLGDLIPRLMT
jgi:VIT1/CCC1 family predicted Fe2+/Mn2+ transporter